MADVRTAFAPDHEWAACAEANGYPPQTDESDEPSTSIVPAELDIPLLREFLDMDDDEWRASSPLEKFDYVSRTIEEKTRDNTIVHVKVSCPTASRLGNKEEKPTVPVLFTLHGGGFVSGSHASEEQWLLRPVFPALDLMIVSVEYSLAPEHKFPRWYDDCWDVLTHLLRDPQFFAADLPATCDLNRLFLAGSSAGGGICAGLSQMCRDQGISIAGVILNVPMLCDYHMFKTPNTSGTSMSYLQCANQGLGADYLVSIWDMLRTGPAAREPISLWSPMLGEVKDLPPHLIFVAGRDPLRDEGLEYARRLQAEGVASEMHLYPGVAHDFGKTVELTKTREFYEHVVSGLAHMAQIEARNNLKI